MRVDELMRSLMRRPVALVLIVAMAVAGGWFGYTGASNTYQSSATVLVVPPMTPDADGTMDNPFTRLDFSTSQLALVVATQLASDGVRDRVIAAGGSGQYESDTLSSSNSATAQLTPQVSLSASAATAEEARLAIEVLIEQASAQLAAVQSASNVPFAARADIVVSSPATAPALVGNPQVRAAGVFGIAAGFVGLLLLVAALPFLERRSRRRAVPSAEQPVHSHEPVMAEPRSAQPSPEPKPTSKSKATSRAPSAPRRKSRTKTRPTATTRPRAAGPVGSVPAVVFAAPDLTHVSPVSEDPAPPTGPAAVDAVPPGRPSSQRRQEILRQMVRDDYRRSGSTVAWSRAEQRVAYLRAEDRLAHSELLRDGEGGTISRLEDYVAHRDHG